MIYKISACLIGKRMEIKMSGKLHKKVAVITGSSRGLGFAMAEAFAAEGAAVIISARTEAAVEAAVRQLRQAGYPASGMAVDVTNPDQVECLARLAQTEFGGLDIWVNNAGVGAPYGPTLDITPDRFQAVIQTNITGTYNGSYTAMRRFLPQGSGKLINLIGRGAKSPVPLQNAYTSSKAWVLSFTTALSKEYQGSGVDIFAYNPGLVITDMLNNMEAIQGFGSQASVLETVMRLWANPPAVPAQKAAWLASSASDGKNGMVMDILTPGAMLGGLAREAWRVITFGAKPATTLNIREVAPAGVEAIGCD
jgi:glucose 1-dehydrogenase